MTTSKEVRKEIKYARVRIAHLLNKKAHGKKHAAPIQTEHEVAVHIHESLARFLED